MIRNYFKIIKNHLLRSNKTSQKAMQSNTLPSNLAEVPKKGKVFMFSKSYCPYCDRAKGILNDLKISFDFVECDEVELTSNQRAQLTKMTNVTTFPNTFIGEKSIGGCDNLTKLKNNGELFKICDEQGVSYEK
jgi:glutaredoxin 3